MNAEEEGEDDDPPATGPVKISLGNGNDTLSFVGAVNNGPGTHNLHFGEVDELDEEEVPTFDGDGQPTPATPIPADGSILPGTPGTNDVLNVLDHSNVLLGDVINFEHLTVSTQSILTLTGQNYAFGSAAGLGSGSVLVDATSQLVLAGHNATLETGHFDLFGTLKIGLPPGDEDDEDDEDVETLARGTRGERGDDPHRAFDIRQCRAGRPDAKR